MQHSSSRCLLHLRVQPSVSLSFPLLTSALIRSPSALHFPPCLLELNLLVGWITLEPGCPRKMFGFCGVSPIPGSQIPQIIYSWTTPLRKQLNLKPCPKSRVPGLLTAFHPRGASCLLTVICGHWSRWWGLAVDRKGWEGGNKVFSTTGATRNLALVAYWAVGGWGWGLRGGRFSRETKPTAPCYTRPSRPWMPPSGASRAVAGQRSNECGAPTAEAGAALPRFRRPPSETSDSCRRQGCVTGGGRCRADRGRSRGDLGGYLGETAACVWLCEPARCESRHGLGVWLLGLDWGLCQQCLCWGKCGRGKVSRLGRRQSRT